jgi:hypothetical protein
LSFLALTSFLFARCGLARVLGFNKTFQAGEACAPEDTVLLDPGIDGAQRLRIQPVDTVAAFAVLADQVGAAQEAKVLGNGWTGDGKGLRDLSGGLSAAAEKIENSAAGRIGESLKSGFGVLPCLGLPGGICNRAVTHNA